MASVLSALSAMAGLALEDILATEIQRKILRAVARSMQLEHLIDFLALLLPFVTHPPSPTPTPPTAAALAEGDPAVTLPGTPLAAPPTAPPLAHQVSSTSPREILVEVFDNFIDDDGKCCCVAVKV